MAKFFYKTIKCGFEGRDIKEVTAISHIRFEPEDETVVIPDEHDGHPVTHVMFYQATNMPYVRYHDWHHSTGGEDDYVPREFYADTFYSLNIPEHVKRIVFPSSVENIALDVFNKVEHVEYVIVPENRHFTACDGKICRKKG